MCFGTYACIHSGFSAPAWAQNVRTINGTVKDPQGPAIPGATATLSNRVSQAMQTAITNEQGKYTYRRAFLPSAFPPCPTGS